MASMKESIKSILISQNEFYHQPRTLQSRLLVVVFFLYFQYVKIKTSVDLNSLTVDLNSLSSNGKLPLTRGQWNCHNTSYSFTTKDESLFIKEHTSL